MAHDPANVDRIKEAFWKALAHSPFVMLQLRADPEGVAPMTAQLDREADSAVWFFVRSDNRFSQLGDCSAIFCAKGHELFARFDGRLALEVRNEVREKLWDNSVEAWFPNGKGDPAVLLLRMDLGEAAIWYPELGMTEIVKMMLGFDVRSEGDEGYAEVAL